MANFIFNWATAALASATLDLSTGNYYAHIVTTVPTLANSTVADLVLPTASSYTSAPLTGLSYTTARWTFNSFSFPKYSFVSAPTGVVICRRSGSVPAATDSIICYSDFNNSIGQVINLQVGAYNVFLQFGSNGAINFSYRYQYNSAAYNAAAGAFPQGIIFLLGTKNNTLAFSNPFNATTSPNGITFTDRVANASASTRVALDFGVNSIRIGTAGINFVAANSLALTIWGSNFLPTFTSTDIDNNALWTSLGTIASYVSGWNFINVTNNTYFRYFKFTRTGGVNDLNEFEFYNSSIYSPTANFV